MKKLVFNNTLLFQKLFGNEIKAISETEIAEAPYYEIHPYSDNQDIDQILLVYHDDKDNNDSIDEIDLSYFDGLVADAFYSMIYDDNRRLSKKFTLTELLHAVSCSDRTQLTKQRRKMLEDSLNRLYRYEIFIFMRPDGNGNFTNKLKGRLIDFQQISKGKKTFYKSNDDEPVLNRYTRALAESKVGSGEQKITAADYNLGVYEDELRIPRLTFITKTSMMLTRLLWMRLEVEKRRTKECTILVYTKDGGGIIGKLIGRKKWRDLIKNDLQKLYRLIGSVIEITENIFEYYKNNGYIKEARIDNGEKFIVEFYDEDQSVDLWKAVTNTYTPNIRIPLLESEIDRLDQYLNDIETDRKMEKETADRLIKKCERLLETLKALKTTDQIIDTDLS